MRTLESWNPPGGLSIPCVTILDPDGGPIEEDQRRLTRYLIQSGRGADVIFVMGTTGEWKCLDLARRQHVCRVVVEEVRKANPQLEAAGHRPVEAWVGITGNSAVGSQATRWPCRRTTALGLTRAKPRWPRW